MKNGMAIIDLGRVSVLVFESAKTREALVDLLKSGPHHMTRIAVGPEDASDADLEAAIRVSVAQHPCEAADAPVVVARGGKAFATLAWPIDLDVIRHRMERFKKDGPGDGPRPIARPLSDVPPEFETFRLLEQVTDCIQPVQEQAALDRIERKIEAGSSAVHVPRDCPSDVCPDCGRHGAVCAPFRNSGYGAGPGRGCGGTVVHR